jgi:hypothetical protein
VLSSCPSWAVISFIYAANADVYLNQVIKL